MMKRTDVYSELIGLASSLDDHVTSEMVSVALHDLADRIEWGFEDEE